MSADTFARASTKTKKTFLQRHQLSLVLGLLFVVATLLDLGLAGYLGFAAPEGTAGLELRANDAFLRLRHRLRPPVLNPDIVVVGIDETSMQEIALPWPWPRAIHGDLIEALKGAGASVIALDIVFAEATEGAFDTELANQLSQAGNVVLAEDLEEVDDGGFARQVWIPPLEALATAARASGMAKVKVDPDGFIRRAPLVVDASMRSREVLALATARVFAASVGRELDLPADLTEPILINYLGPPRTFKTVSYYQALDPDQYLPKDIFKGKVVLVGRTLTSFADFSTVDFFPHPFISRDVGTMSGVEIHANVLDTILRRRYIRPLPAPANIALFLVLLGFGAAVLGGIKRPILSLPLFLFGLVAFVALQYALFHGGARLGHVVVPSLVYGFFLIAERLFRYIVLDREKRFIHGAFQHFVPPDVVAQLIANPDQLNLYGEFFDTTVVFTDLVGFTTLAERWEPIEIRQFLTDYFTEMVDIMLANKGTLDKFIGDAMMCFFGVPVRTDEHAYQGAMTAFQMHKRLRELNVEWAKRGLPPLGMRLGVNTGRVVAGNMGTKTLFNFTIMGDCVNLGSRLEGANKFYGTSIIMGQDTERLLGDRVDKRKLDDIQVKGRKVAISIYELLGPKGTMDEAMRRRVAVYESAFKLYQQRQFEQAIAELRTIAAEDPPAQALLERCEDYARNPPAADWDGVYVATSK